MPRTTNDLDLVIHLPFAEREGVRSLLEKAQFTSIEERKDAIFGLRLAGLSPEGVLLELFFARGNDVHDREFGRRRRIPFGGVDLWFESPEDLVLRKLVNTRFRRGMDFQDAVTVLARQGANLDVAYVRQHCGLYRVCAKLDEALGLAEAANGPAG